MIELIKKAHKILQILLMEIKMRQQLFAYQRSKTPQRYGIRPRINRFSDNRPLHYHDFFELEVVCSGHLIYEVNGAKVELSRGDVIAVSPGDIHQYACQESTLVLRFAVLFKDVCSAVQRMISSVEFPFYAHLSEESLAETISTFEKLMSAVETKGEFDSEIIGARATVFLTLCMESRESLGNKQSDSYKYVARAMRYITENCTAQITLADVAKAVSLTPSYFSRIFSDINGRSFVEYLAEKRIERAKKMLTSTDVSITDIAFSSGFGSFSSFSRIFLRQVGVTPRQFRKLSHNFD